MENKMKISKILLLIIIISAGFACGRKTDGRFEEHIITVHTFTPLPAPLQSPVRASGRISPASSVRLSFKTGGVIERLYAEAGETVREGRILAALKMDEIEAQAGMAKSALEKAERDYQRAENLYADKVITLELLQNAETGLKAAQSRYRIAAFNRSHSKITAPADGHILMRLAEENEMIGPGHPVYVLGTFGSSWLLKTGITDRDRICLNTGDSASVRLDVYPDIHIPAVVTRLAAAPDAATGLFEAELTLEAEGLKILSGFIARARIFPKSEKTGLRIPFSALAEGDGTRGHVFTPEADGTARKREVQIAWMANNEAVIYDSEEKIKEVITEGAFYLKDGSKIQIVKNKTGADQ